MTDETGDMQNLRDRIAVLEEERRSVAQILEAAAGHAVCAFDLEERHLNEKGGVTHVDYGRPDRAPLLLITGEHDHVVPPAIGRAILKKYRRHAMRFPKEPPAPALFLSVCAFAAKVVLYSYHPMVPKMSLPYMTMLCSSYLCTFWYWQNLFL